jgi:hypothetical protein
MKDSDIRKLAYVERRLPNLESRTRCIADKYPEDPRLLEISNAIKEAINKIDQVLNPNKSKKL